MRELLPLTLLASTILLCSAKEREADGSLLEEMKTLSRRLERVEETSEMKIAQLEEDLIELKQSVSLKDIRIEKLEESLAMKESRLEILEENISELEDPPFAFICGYQSNFLQENTDIFYSKLLYSRSGGYNPNNNTNGNGFLHIKTGIFNCHCPGTWEISWSMTTVHYYQGDVNEIFLVKNGQKILESEHYTWVNDFYAGDYYTDTFGGRSLYLHLAEGDELQLRTENINSLYNIIACFSLARADTLN